MDAYVPADAAANGRRIIRAAARVTARGMPVLMPHLHRIEPKPRVILLTWPFSVKQVTRVRAPAKPIDDLRATQSGVR
jgi:hypothetical protein